MFLDAGDITDEFVAGTTALSQSNWSNDYFSTITMTLGESKIYVDGQEAETSCPPMIDDYGQLILPVLELAQSVGAEAEMNEQTGSIEIEAENGNVSLNALMEEVASNELPVNTDEADATTTQNVTITDNNTIITEMTDGSTITQLPVISESQAEEVFNLDVDQDGDKIIITNPYQTKEIIVYVKNGQTLQNTRNAEAVVTNGEGLYFLQYETEEQTKTAYEAFQADNTIEHVTLNEIVASTALPSPGSWGTDGNENSMGIQASRMITHLQNNNNEIVVAVVDSGADAEYLPGTEGGRSGHSHLQGKTTTPTSATDDTAGWNFINNTNDPYDDRGHGTHVSGTIVDCTPDNVVIMPIKSLNSNGFDVQIGDEWSVDLGIKYAADHGADVINLSLGGSCISDNCSTKNAIDYAITTAQQNNETPPIFVVAAGNDNINTQNACPARLGASYDNVITVGAVDQFDLPACFSNYGDAVTVCAPGVGILSSLPGGGYGTKSGTSMATPHVSAAVAMLCLEYTNYTPAQIKNTLKSMTVDLGTSGWDGAFGSGRIDFRMLSGNGLDPVYPVAATGFDLKKTSNYGTITTYSSITLNKLFESQIISALVTPKDATNKSVSYAVINNSVAKYENSRITAQEAGAAVLVATKDGFPEKRGTIYVGEHWMYCAADSFSGGTGTATNPYLINNAEQLAKLSYDTYFGNTDYYGVYFKMTSDIDLLGKIWTPIKEFRGYFNGDGHNITNMTVTESIIDKFINEYNQSGLFAYIITPCEIENLAVLDATVNVDSFEYGGSGIICGEANNVKIINCYTTGNVTRGAGIAGSISNSVIRDCFSVVENSAAGLVMGNTGSFIYNSYSAGTTDSLGTGFSTIQQAGSVINSFSTINASSGNGFIKDKNGGSIQKCYYLSGNTYGIKNDSTPSETELSQKPISFFRNQSSYTTVSNWDSSSPWDFEDVWEIDGNYNNGLPYLRMFRTETPVTSVSLNKSVLKLQNGQTETLIATAAPSNATNQSVTWTSSNNDVATVNENGMVTAHSSTGTAIITATANGDSNVSATCTFYADDHADTSSAATTASLHTSISANIEIGGDVDYFKFVPATTGTYLFYTTGTMDTKGVLYNSVNTQLASNDDWAGANNRNFGIKYSLTANQTYYIKVNAFSSTSTGSYTFVVDDDHGNIAAMATTVTLHSQTTGNIETIGDVDYFKFIPSATGTYLFYTTGLTDTKGVLYSSSETQLVQNDDASISGNNFAFKYSLTAGQTYYIKVSAYNTNIGAYTFVVSKDFYSASLTNTNQDARKVQMSAEAASVLTTMQVKIGNNTYTLNKPTSGSLDTTVNGARFKVTFTSLNGGFSTEWNITASIPATIKGSTDTVSFTFSKGVITGVKSSDFTGLIAYKSSIKTGVDARATNNLQQLLVSMASTDYTLEVFNWDNSSVTVTSTTKAKTGMKIIQRDSSNRIVEVYYVVLFGDVMGTGTVVNIGDGLITADDAQAVLQHSVASSQLGALAQISADVNHNEIINSDDAMLILQHSENTTTINQNYTFSNVPDDCYYGNSVIF